MFRGGGDTTIKEATPSLRLNKTKTDTTLCTDRIIFHITVELQSIVLSSTLKIEIFDWAFVLHIWPFLRKATHIYSKIHNAR